MIFFGRQIALMYGPKGAESPVKIDKLRISFKVHKSLDPAANTCEITVYNTVTKFEKSGVVILQAGYENAASIFVGEIITSGIKKAVPDVITEVKAKDGWQALSQIAIVRSFPKNTGVEQIVSDVMTEMKVDQRVGTIPPFIYQRGLKFHGTCRDLLNIVAKDAGFSWAIVNGGLKICPKGLPDTETIFILSPETGLLETPKKIYDDKTKRNGIEAKALLFPVEPGSRVQVAGTFYRVEEMDHVGDQFDGDFSTTITAFEVTK